MYQRDALREEVCNGRDEMSNGSAHAEESKGTTTSYPPSLNQHPAKITFSLPSRLPECAEEDARDAVRPDVDALIRVVDGICEARFL